VVINFYSIVFISASYKAFIIQIQKLIQERSDLKVLLLSHSEAELKSIDSKYDKKIWLYFEVVHYKEDALKVHYGDQNVNE